MPLNIIELGKRQLRKILPTEAENAIGILEQSGVLNTGIVVNNRGKEPQRGYMWEVSFRDNQGRGEFITLYAKNTNIPASINENIKRMYAGVEYSYSGRDTSPRVFRVTFWDNQDQDVYNFFTAWYASMQQGKSRRKVNPVNYQRDITLQLKDSLGIQNGNTITMTHAYPTEIGDVPLSYADSSEFTFDVMFSFREKVTT
tara:strand:- start:644 stop:1243 length:600 start_codon:yes stop_codon:yes gene_type:complete